MKILAFGDIHGDSAHAEKLAQQALDEKVDLVVICGDITHFEKSTDNIIGPFKKRDLKVLLIPGNHESLATADFLADLYSVTNLHGYTVKYDDVALFGCGLANVGPHDISEGEIFKLLEKGYNYTKDSRKKIMVTHVHPSGSKMEQFSQFFEGSQSVRKAVDQFQPDFLLCAHVHEAAGLEEKIGNTKVINVGKQGKIIEL